MSKVSLLKQYSQTPAILLLAVVANLLIFYVIQQMVTNDRFRAPSLESVNLVDFIRVKEQQEKIDEIVEEEIIEEPPPPDEPPPPPEMIEPEVSKPEVAPLDLPMPDLDVPLGVDGTPYIGDFMKSAKPAKPVAKPSPVKPKIRTDVVPTKKIPPKYPKRALRSGIEGVVTVEFTITTTGGVKDAVIVKADPPKIFDRAVLRSIAKWKFNPEMKDGKKIEIRARQDINFRLQK